MRTFLHYLVRHDIWSVKGTRSRRVIVAYLLSVAWYRRDWPNRPPAGDQHIGVFAHWRRRQGVWLQFPRRLTVHISVLDVRVRDRDGIWWLRRRGDSNWLLDDLQKA